jgi:hypothetical protein
MYHLQKRETIVFQNWNHRLLVTNSASGKSADIDKVSYNYFTKAIILNNRIKKRARQ